jgi:flavodoxin
VKPLVVFYSRTGTTKKVAETISNILKCDVEEVFDTKNRAGVLGWLRSGRDAGSKKPTAIEKAKKNPDLTKDLSDKSRSFRFFYF